MCCSGNYFIPLLTCCISKTLGGRSLSNQLNKLLEITALPFAFTSNVNIFWAQPFSPINFRSAFSHLELSSDKDCVLQKMVFSVQYNKTDIIWTA